jgi:hypothetical protein
VLSARPKVAELVFQLYGRVLHPELFEIHASRRIDRGEYSVVVAITHAGHLVTWRKDGLTLTEVAAGAGQPPAPVDSHGGIAPPRTAKRFA